MLNTIQKWPIGKVLYYNDHKEIIQKEKIKPTIKMKFSAFMKYLEYAKKLNINFNQIKVHAQNFTRGIPNSAKIRNSLARTKELDELLKIIRNVVNIS